MIYSFTSDPFFLENVILQEILIFIAFDVALSKYFINNIFTLHSFLKIKFKKSCIEIPCELVFAIFPIYSFVNTKQRVNFIKIKTMRGNMQGD